MESLVDYHTWVIDDSVFVQPDRGLGDAAYAPDAIAVEEGTRDKLFIGGRYYSDKSPVPALAMAGIYQVLQWTTGLMARAEPARFCYLFTLFTSGLAYVISVCAIDGVARALPAPTRLLVTFSFAFATVALPYARQVNNHILLLAVSSVLLFFLNPRTRGQLVAAGMLLGAAYTIDLGILRKTRIPGAQSRAFSGASRSRYSLPFTRERNAGDRLGGELFPGRMADLRDHV